jgi:hypothetical protein
MSINPIEKKKTNGTMFGDAEEMLFTLASLGSNPSAESQVAADAPAISAAPGAGGASAGGMGGIA